MSLKKKRALPARTTSCGHQHGPRSSVPYYIPFPHDSAKRGGSPGRSGAAANKDDLLRRLSGLLLSFGIRYANPFYDDCFQEACLAVLLAPEPCTDAFLRQTAKFAAVNFLKREYAENKKIFIRDTGGEDTMEEQIIEKLEREREYRELIRYFTPRQSFIYVLCVYSCLTQQQIADTMGVTARTVRRDFADVREKLERLNSGGDGHNDVIESLRRAARARRLLNRAAGPPRDFQECL